jgi:ribosomal-protein-alanine N-acetyltransferase
MMNYSIEVITSEAEAGQLAGIERECFAHPLEETQIRSLLGDEKNIFLAAREGGLLTGSVWVQTVLDEGYIGNVAVRPAFRRRGLADALLNALHGLGRERGLSFLTLEVRAGNAPAIALYEKNGYTRVGRRPGYYDHPKEDAILMTYKIEQEKL